MMFFTSSQGSGTLREISQELFKGFLKLGSDVDVQGLLNLWKASCALHKGNWLKEQVVIKFHPAASLLNCETAGLCLLKGDIFSFALRFHVE